MFCVGTLIQLAQLRCLRDYDSVLITAVDAEAWRGGVICPGSPGVGSGAGAGTRGLCSSHHHPLKIPTVALESFQSPKYFAWAVG